MKKYIIISVMLMISLMLSSCFVAKKVAEKVLEEEISSLKEEQTTEKEETTTVEETTKDANDDEEDSKEETKEESRFSRDYTYEDSISKMLVIFGDGGKYGIKDLKGNILYPANSDYIRYLENTRFIQRIDENNNNFLIDMLTRREYLLEEGNAEQQIFDILSKDKTFSIEEENGFYAFTKNGERVTEPVYNIVDYPLDGYVVAMNTESYYYEVIDTDGNVVVPSSQWINHLGFNLYIDNDVRLKEIEGDEISESRFINQCVLDENLILVRDLDEAYFMDRQGNRLEKGYNTDNIGFSDRLLMSFGNIVLVNEAPDDFMSTQSYTILDKYGNMLYKGEEIKLTNTLENGDYIVSERIYNNALNNTSFVQLFSEDKRDKYDDINALLDKEMRRYEGVEIIKDDEKTYFNIGSYIGINESESIINISYLYDIYYYFSYVQGSYYLEQEYYIDKESGEVYNFASLFHDFEASYDDIAMLIARKLLDYGYIQSLEDMDTLILTENSSFSVMNETLIVDVNHMLDNRIEVRFEQVQIDFDELGDMLNVDSPILTMQEDTKAK